MQYLLETYPRSATSDALAACTAAGMAAERVENGRMSPSLALNFKDLTMDRYKHHMDGIFIRQFIITCIYESVNLGRDKGQESPDSFASDDTELLLNTVPDKTRGFKGKRSCDNYESYNAPPCNGKRSGMEMFYAYI